MFWKKSILYLTWIGFKRNLYLNVDKDKDIVMIYSAFKKILYFKILQVKIKYAKDIDRYETILQ